MTWQSAARRSDPAGGFSSPVTERLSHVLRYLPYLSGRVEIPGEAVGDDRTDLFNTICCIECGTGFDYDDEEIAHDGDDQGPE